MVAEIALEEGKEVNFSTIIGSLRLVRARLAGKAAFAAMSSHCDIHFPGAVVIRSISPEVGIEIMKVDGAAGEGLSTYLTKGLSRYPMPTGLSGSRPRSQELSVTVDSTCTLPIEEVLQSVAKSCLYCFKALSPRTTYEFSFAEEFQDSTLTIAGVFASNQVWLEPDALEVGEVSGMQVSIVELVPITSQELEFVRNDLPTFIANTLNGQIDLLDFQR